MAVEYPRTFRLLESLPIELVAEIFCHAITAWSPNTTHTASGRVEQEFTPLRLGAVCWGWRALAWRTPSLWSGVRIYATPKRIAAQIVLSDEWLSRSGSLPLDITLCSDGSVDWQEEGLDLHSLILTANRYAPRWRSLVLQVPGYSCRALPETHIQLPFLEELRIDTKDNGPNDLISLQGATAIRRLNLNLCSVYLTTINIPLSNITHLNVDYCILAEFLYLLPNCPLLANIVVQYLRPNVGLIMQSLFDIPQLPLELLSVRSLKLCDPNPSEVGVLFDSIVTPNLEELTYDGLPPTDLTSFCAFLSRCPTLQEFSLFNQDLSSRQMIQILQELKTIKTFNLKVSAGRCENLPLEDQLLDMLHPSPGTQYLLPKLEELTFTGGLSFTWPHFIAAWKARRNVKEFGEVEWKSWNFTITSGAGQNFLLDKTTMDKLENLENEAGGRLELSFLDEC